MVKSHFKNTMENPFFENHLLAKGGFLRFAISVKTSVTRSIESRRWKELLVGRSETQEHSSLKNEPAKSEVTIREMFILLIIYFFNNFDFFVLKISSKIELFLQNFGFKHPHPS